MCYTNNHKYNNIVIIFKVSFSIRSRQLSIFCASLAVKWAGDHYNDVKNLTIPLNQRIDEFYWRSYLNCNDSQVCKDNVEIMLTNEFYEMLSDVKKVRFVIFDWNILSLYVFRSHSKSVQRRNVCQGNWTACHKLWMKSKRSLVNLALTSNLCWISIEWASRFWSHIPTIDRFDAFVDDSQIDWNGEIVKCMMTMRFLEIVIVNMFSKKLLISILSDCWWWNNVTRKKRNDRQIETGRDITFPEEKSYINNNIGRELHHNQN